MKWENKKVLITGGAGFIGKNLINKLQGEKANIIVLDNFYYKNRSDIPKVCSVIEGDVTDSKVLKRIPYVDFVFHFAGPSSIVLFNQSPKECLDVTVKGFINILEWSKNNKIKKLIYPSSGSVYGTAMPQRENILPEPVNLYGIAKMSCEYIARFYSSWVKNTGLRIYAGYGPGEEHKGEIASVIAIFMRAIKEGKSPVIYGNGKQTRDFIYIDDVIDLIILAAENDTPSIMNAGSGSSYSFNKVVGFLNELLNKNVKPTYKEKPVNYLERTKADMHSTFSILGKKPVGLKTGLKKYINSLNIKNSHDR